MDSAPQELLEEIIDHLSGWDAAASSLVSRRWRHRSQQRYFESVLFLSAHQVALWEANIPQDPDGIVSYVRHVRFDSALRTSLEPTTFGRLLKSFESMVSLTIQNTEIPLPGELTGPVSLGEFGNGVTRLVLAHALYAPLTAVVSFILSFPNLKELAINSIIPTPYDPSPALPAASKRGPLELLVLWKIPPELSADLARGRLTSQTLCMNLYGQDGGKLIVASSESVVTLILLDASEFLPRPLDRSPAFVSPLPSLTTVRVRLGSRTPTPRMVRLLSSILQAPNLCTVVFACNNVWLTARDFAPPGCWSIVDEWLANLAMTRAMAGGSLEVVLAQLIELPGPVGYFPEFRNAGGEIRREASTAACGI